MYLKKEKKRIAPIAMHPEDPRRSEGYQNRCLLNSGMQTTIRRKRLRGPLLQEIKQYIKFVCGGSLTSGQLFKGSFQTEYIKRVFYWCMKYVLW